MHHDKFEIIAYRATNVTVTPCLATAEHTVDNYLVLTNFTNVGDD